MAKPLMPKATAVWLVDNTALSFQQIAEFCDLHPLEVKGIADGEVAVGIVGYDPVANSQLSQKDLDASEADANVPLKLMSTGDMPRPVVRSKGPRYTPVAKRQEKPDAIAWLVRTYPAVKDAQIVKLVGTTKTTISAIRDRSHWNYANLQPRDPVLLGLCTQADFNKVVEKLQADEEKVKAAAEASASDFIPDNFFAGNAESKPEPSEG